MKGERPDKKVRFPQIVSSCAGQTIAPEQLLHIIVSVKNSRRQSANVDVYLTPRQLNGGRDTINTAVATATEKHGYYVSHRIIGLVNKEDKKPIALAS